MNNISRRLRATFLLGALLIASSSLVACDSNADKASENISKEAEQFKVMRTIVQTNGITDKVYGYGSLLARF